METLACIAAIGAVISLLCSIAFVENVKIVLKEDKLKSNKDLLILVCDQDPPHSVTFEKVTFLSANDHYDLKPVSGGTDFSTLSNYYEFNMENYLELNNATKATSKPKPKVIISERGGAKKLTDLNEGDWVVFVCDVEPETTPILQRKWLHSGKDITSKKSYGITVEKNNTLLVFRKLQKYHAGDYVCEVTTDNHAVTIHSNTLTIPFVKEYIPPPPKSTDQVEIPREFVTQKPFVPPHWTTEFDDTIMSLELRKGIVPDKIQENDDVSFFCKFKSTKRSPVVQIYYHNNQELYTNEAAGIIITPNSLELRRIKPSSAGEYFCETKSEKLNQPLLLSSPPLISGTSQPVRINVIARTRNNSNAYILLGGGREPNSIIEFNHVYFQCIIKDTIKPIRKIKWIHNGTMLRPSDNIHILQTVSILIISPITKNLAGEYSCIAVTAKGNEERSNVLKVHVNDNPMNDTETTNLPVVITDQALVPNLIEVNDTLEFNCRVFAWPRVTVRNIRWLHDGVEIKESRDKRIQKNLLRLFIKNIRKTETGNYSCVVDIDSADSYTGIRTVPSFPFILSNIQDQTEATKVIEEFVTMPKPTLRVLFENTTRKMIFDGIDGLYTGVTVYFVCDVQPDTLNIDSISWYKNGIEMQPEDKGEFLYGNYTLVLHQIGYRAVGNYSCQADVKNDVYLVKAQGVLIMPQLTKPEDFIANKKRIYLIPELQHDPDSICERDVVYMYCNIYPKTSATDIAITWLKNNVVVDQGLDGVMYNRRALAINDVRKHHAGNYSCQIVDNNGTTHTSLHTVRLKVADLTPEHEPQKEVKIFVRTGKSYDIDNIREGGEVKLRCAIKPNTTIVLSTYWVFQSQIILPDDERITFEYGDRVLYMKNITKKFSGEYTCLANTKRGYFYSMPEQFHLDVKNK